MRRVLSAITGLFLIYAIFEIKSMMEDKKTINIMDRAFNKPKIKEDNSRKATIIFKESNQKEVQKN
jgi:hypothetical protein